jgi:hypothetical protein
MTTVKPGVRMPKTHRAVQLVASGDQRLSANQVCWPAQEAMERALAAVLEAEGVRIERMNPVKKAEGHGFIASQREGLAVFREVDPEQPIIVAEAVWQYSHHVLPGLTTHKGPILTLANWSGQWPGLVGLLNLNGSLAKAGVKYSSLWSQDFTDSYFLTRLRQWLKNGKCSHDTSHVQKLEDVTAPKKPLQVGEQLARQLQRDKAIMGVFDEGCMGMFNAILPDHLLHQCGIFKERLSQSQLYHETITTSDEDAALVLEWLEKKGMTFHWGKDHATELTREQVLLQCKMYAAALRLADTFGCDTIGIQYQQGLKDLLPASDLVEGMLNNTDRPPMRVKNASRVLYKGEPLPHFNEVDECAGLDGFLTYRVQKALDQPLESTLHDLRWGDTWGNDFIWTLLISGAAPPAHFVGGWKGAEGFRQPPMYFPNGGSTLRGISREGEIIWSRVFVENEQLHMDLGRGQAVALPKEETLRRWEATTSQWPIMHALFYGITRDQMMARHKSNHIQVCYSTSAHMADECLFAKASMARALGLKVHICGSLKR